MSTKVLVVEDDAETRDITTLMLEMSGYEVIVANSGYEGLTQTVKERPELIVADIMMPHLNGVEMIKLLRSLKEFKTVPILAVTAHGMDLAKEAIAAGANRAMAKPLDFDLVLAFIKELTAKKS